MTSLRESSTEPSIVEPRPENSLAYMGSVATFLLSNEVTGGNLCALSLFARQGSEPPPHVHTRENEMYLVLEGELEVHVEGRDGPITARPGSMVFLPRNKAHTFIYRTDTARFVSFLHSPDGLGTSQSYFEEMALGRPDSMDLPDHAVEYSNAPPKEIRHAADVAGENGIKLLSPTEIDERLPLFAKAIKRGVADRR